VPHIIIEYSDNIHSKIGLSTLIERVHKTAISTGVFPAGGTRTRGEPRTDYRIADGHPDNGFVHLVLRVGHGREEAVLHAAGQEIFDAARNHLQPLFDSSPLAISMEIQEIHPVLTYKQNNLHDYVKARAGAAESK
jgi:5-carboxymethyl-2-hydroxymuconate isomerase